MALDRAAAKIGQRFKDKPLVEAAIRLAIGEAYHSVAAEDPAVPQVERAVKLLQTQLGPEHEDTVKAMQRLAALYMWVGRHEDAVTLRKRILDFRGVYFGSDQPETVASVSDLAAAYGQAGQWETSAQLLERLLESCRVVVGPEDGETLGVLHSLALNYGHLDRLEESLLLHQKVLDGFGAGTDPENRIWCLMTFAQVCQRAGKLDQSERLLREATRGLPEISRRDVQDKNSAPPILLAGWPGPCS